MRARLFSSSLLLGLAYGIAVTAVEMWLGALQILRLGMPPMPLNMATAAALEVALGAVLGLATMAIGAAGARRVLQAAAMVAAWIALERYVAVDPANVGRWVTGPLAGLALLGLATLMARRRTLAPWALGLATLAAAVSAPTVAYRLRADDGPAPTSSVAAKKGAPDVVLVVIDTVRAQSMSAYGYERPTTPVFARLADEGALFLDATAPSTWSLPSHASLFTGWYPSVHGAHGEHRFLGDHPPTLAEVFARNGYETLCFTANPHISAGFGLTRGFSWSDRAWASGAGGRSFIFIYRVLDLLGYSANDKGGADVAANFEQWVASRRGDDRPAFAFLNFLEAHFPYHQLPGEYLGRFTSRPPSQLRKFSVQTFGAQFGRKLSSAEVEAAIEPSRNMYDGGVAYSDHLLGRVVDALAKAGRLDDTVLIVLADHGELVGEHGYFGHGPSLHQPDLHVPLLIRYPPRVAAGVRVESPVSTVGVYATALELSDLQPPTQLHVGSLVPALEGGAAGVPVIAERFRSELMKDSELPLGNGRRRYRVYRSGINKLVEDSAGELFLFDLGTDPGETNNLAAELPQELARLRGELAAWTAALELPPLAAELDFAAAPDLDPAAQERLRALGYLE